MNNLSLREIFRASSLLQSYAKKPLDLQSTAELHCTAMDHKEYERIKRDIQNELEAAQTECKKRLDALEVIWAMEQGKQPSVDLFDSITWSDMARKVIPSLPETFTRYELEKAVLERFPEAKERWRKNSLGGILTRMQSREEIEVAEPGSGPKPARYRLKKRTRD
jgi:superfamily II DNA helicase RecQ